MDTATGLLYVGNGQYYDPTTGRFLNRNAKPDQTNPYVPWGGNPSSAFMAPLALLWLIYSRKKKRGKMDMFIILLMLGVSLSMSLAACSVGTHLPPTVAVKITIASTQTPGIAAATITAPAISSTSITVPVKAPTPNVCTETTIILSGSDSDIIYGVNNRRTAFYNAALKYKSDLSSIDFPIELFLAQGAAETGAGKNGDKDWANEYVEIGKYGGLMQVDYYSGFNHEPYYHDTQIGYYHNVKDAIDFLTSFTRSHLKNMI